ERQPRLSSQFARGPESFDAVGHVDVLEVAPLAVADQEILPPVQVHIEKDRSPGPFRGFQAGIVSRLGEGAIAAVDLKSIAQNPPFPSLTQIRSGVNKSSHT